MADSGGGLFPSDQADPETAERNLPHTGIAGRTGILPFQDISTLRNRNMIQSAHSLDQDQIQPSSLDLRLGAKAYGLRASFLPGPTHLVKEQLETLKQNEIDLQNGAVLKEGSVYLVELQESLNLPTSLSAITNPKSSTGRLDVFTRLITDKSEAFDWVEGGYSGPLYAEIFPRTFSVTVREGSRLNQMRFWRRSGNQDRYSRPGLSDTELRMLNEESPLVDGDPKAATIRSGLNVRVDLLGRKKGEIIGYRARKHADVVDVDRKRAYPRLDFWEPIRANGRGRLILSPDEFYILASKERIRVPPNLAAEMVPIDPMMGEFRAHYAGFFDPGFGCIEGQPGSKAVLEVRTLEVPFVLEHGQIIARLLYENLAGTPTRVYGREIRSHYQGQGLKLSKHFR